MPEPPSPDELATLVRVDELTTAQLLRGRLEAEGIRCTLADEQLAQRTWHHAVGGIRVQVRRADLERAQEILAQPGAGDAELAAQAREVSGAASAPARDEDITISAGDRAAFRSLRVTLASLWLMGLIHPYSLWLAVRALRRKDVTPWGQRRAGIALLVSLAGCVWLVLLVYHFASLGR